MFVKKITAATSMSIMLLTLTGCAAYIPEGELDPLGPEIEELYPYMISADVYATNSSENLHNDDIEVHIELADVEDVVYEDLQNIRDNITEAYPEHKVYLSYEIPEDQKTTMETFMDSALLTTLGEPQTQHSYVNPVLMPGETFYPYEYTNIVGYNPEDVNADYIASYVEMVESYPAQYAGHHLTFSEDYANPNILDMPFERRSIGEGDHQYCITIGENEYYYNEYERSITIHDPWFSYCNQNAM